MEKITKRSMFEALAAYADAHEMDVSGITAADFVAFAEKEIESLDKKAEQAKVRVAKKRAEGDALTEMVYAALTDELETAADIAGRVEDETATIAKISYRLRTLVADGRATKEDVKVEREGKKVTLKGYKKIG